MQNTYSKDELIQELEFDAMRSFISGKRNNRTDMALSIVTVIASLTAAVLVSTKDMYPWIIASVAALPAACSSLQRLVGFRERSDWYFQHADEVRRLLFELKFTETPNLVKFARKRGELEVELGRAWRRIGRSGAKSFNGTHDEVREVK